MKKVFVIAMKCEAETVVANLADVRSEMMFGREVFHGKLDGKTTAVVVAGIGKVNAAAGTQLAIGSLGAEVVLNIGVAGGLDSTFKVGDVFRVARTVQYDFDLSKINGTPIGTLDERQTPFFDLPLVGNWPDATVASGDRFMDSAEGVDFLKKTFCANICEMELGAIAHVAFRAGVPLYSVKAISDVAGHGTQAGQYKDNLKKCLEILKREVPKFFAAVP